ncbi:RNA polymerase II C-terminal domain kinase beta subunit [Coemansia sp. RSA 1822]|nr:RNA polymerase II C-terminal domain kinase beta subunit [Coemansia sp. RSA 720]KAJ2561949.1 RNA polymerase II C-terminal domain kinase beta subunit [Coemansia sp. RSA 1822]
MSMVSSSRRTFMTRKAIESRLSSSGETDRTELLAHPSMVSATKSCILAKEVGRSLGFPARTIATAQLLVHRVHIFQPTVSVSSSDLGAACLLVAAKMEETIKRVRDILAHTYLLFATPVGTAFEPHAVPASVTDKMRHAVLAAEQTVLDAIGFDFRTAHPHLLFVKLAQMAGVPQDTTARTGWLILADAFFTTLPVQYPAVVLAAGALCLAWNLDLDVKDTVPCIRKALFAQQSQGRRSNGRDAWRSLGRAHNGRNADARMPRERPTALDMAGEWWTEFGVATVDVQSFVRQIVDFYVLFFNTTVASAEHMERHQNGLPNKDMSQRIGQWRIKQSEFLNSG